MRRDSHTFRQRASRRVLEMANMIRRVIFRDTTGGLWGVDGYATDLASEGEDDEPVEVFQGLYVYARPGAGDEAEGLMLSVGGKTEHPTIAAVRNEDARLRYVAEFGDIAQGEIAIFNSAGDVRVLMTAGGEVHMGGSGTLQKLMLGETRIADVSTLMTAWSVWLVAHSVFVDATAAPGAAKTAMKSADTALNNALSSFDGAQSSHLASKAKAD